MAKREPKTIRGQLRKTLGGDGRKRLGTSMKEAIRGKKKKR